MSDADRSRDAAAALSGPLALITNAPEAWVDLASLEARWPGSVAELEAAGLAVRWRTAEWGVAVTLTPWGACVLGVELEEDWSSRRSHVEHWAGPYRRRVGGTTRATTHAEAPVEVPRWVPLGRPARPVVLPRRAHEVRLDRPEKVEAPAADPNARWWKDEYTGEPIKLWGMPVPYVRPKVS